MFFKKETAARGTVPETTAKLQLSEWEADSREEVRMKEREKGMKKILPIK